MKYELLSDISGYAKRGSISDLAKFKKELVAEWVRIGVVKPFEYEVADKIIEDKKKLEPVKANRLETPEILSLREKAKELGIKVEDSYGMNKLMFLIDEKLKEPKEVEEPKEDTQVVRKAGRPKKGE